MPKSTSKLEISPSTKGTAFIDLYDLVDLLSPSQLFFQNSFPSYSRVFLTYLDYFIKPHLTGKSFQPASWYNPDILCSSFESQQVCVDVSMRQDTGLREAVGFCWVVPGGMIRSCVLKESFSKMSKMKRKEEHGPD